MQREREKEREELGGVGGGVINLGKGAGIEGDDEHDVMPLPSTQLDGDGERGDA